MNVTFKDVPRAGLSLLEHWWAHEKHVGGVHRIVNEVQGQSPVEDKELLQHFVPECVQKGSDQFTGLEISAENVKQII